MKANEYFKKYGLKGSREHLDWMVRIDARSDIHGDFMGDLKRIIESHELVERVISRHNKSFKECQIDIHGLKSLVKKNPKIYPKHLKQAILDVESCR